VRAWILGHLAWLLYRSLSFTWRVSVQEPASLTQRLKDKKAVLLAHWHGDELALIQLSSRYQIATLSSHSKDGAIMTVVLKRLGAKVVRGSSSRGAVSGYLGLVRLIKKGANCSFAVDGPRGPYHQVKLGVLETSKNLQIPIFCAGVFEKSWNKAYLPKPFAKLNIVWTGPIEIPNKQAELDEKWTREVAEQINAAHQQAQGFIAES
jgi:lysophospholipid acyltransferase (LPLAT)-like uncharacterized protein